VTGYVDVDDQGSYRSFVYANGSMQLLDTLGGNYAEGLAINESGMVAGYSFVAGDNYAHAFLYANGQVIDIGNFGGSDTHGTAINEAGDVVGTGNDADGNWHAFVYSGGKFQDLDELIDPSLGWNFVYAGGINDKGQIAARGCQADFRCADLLLTLVDQGGGDPDPNPVPEPEAFSAGLIGLALLRALRRRQQR
jgi:MYXO-CTERM domain-containing protein